MCIPVPFSQAAHAVLKQTHCKEIKALCFKSSAYFSWDKKVKTIVSGKAPFFKGSQATSQ